MKFDIGFDADSSEDEGKDLDQPDLESDSTLLGRNMDPVPGLMGFSLATLQATV